MGTTERNKKCLLDHAGTTAALSALGEKMGYLGRGLTITQCLFNVARKDTHALHCSVQVRGHRICHKAEGTNVFSYIFHCYEALLLRLTLQVIVRMYGDKAIWEKHWVNTVKKQLLLLTAPRFIHCHRNILCVFNVFTY